MRSGIGWRGEQNISDKGTVRLTTIYNELNWTISGRGELGLLQMVLESDTE